MSWLVVTVFSPCNHDPSYACSEINTLIQRACTAEQALKYAHDKACAFAAEFANGDFALPAFEQSGAYFNANHGYRIVVVVVRPDEHTAEVTCNGQDGDFDAMVDGVDVFES